MNEPDVIKLLIAALAAMIGWVWKHNDRQIEKQAACMDQLREKIAALELKVAGEVASKEDAAQLQRRLDDMAHELGIIGKTMARIEERLRMPPE